MYDKFSIFVQDKKHICVIQAENPDGDSLGSALALEEALADKEVSLYCPVDIPKYMRYFEGWSRVDIEFPYKADAFIIVDTASSTLLSKLLDDAAIRNCLYSAPVLVIDHHETAPDLDFDHEEDGCYVFHFFEVVTNEDESHTATVDWFTVDPKTGETTTITGETFNIGFYAADGNVECAPGYLFDRFLHGEIDAKVYNPLNPLESEGWDTFDYKSINISDLNFEPEEWTYDAFYLGDMLDLDNDGEDEFILDGPYGGMYFDVLDGDLYVFAAATGNAGSLKYTYYEGDCWIVYHDTTHSGRLCYWLYKYEGADNLVDSMTLMGFMDSEDNTEYTFNGESITEGEFVMIHNEIFGVKNLE